MFCFLEGVVYSGQCTWAQFSTDSQGQLFHNVAFRMDVQEEESKLLSKTGNTIFPCLFIIHPGTARDRESRGFNKYGGTSRKPIIHRLPSLHFYAAALNGFDIP